MTVDTKVIERVITISAKPETVFRLLTDGGEYVRWKGESAQLDARPNGVFRVIFPNRTDVVSGRFVEVIPERRVVFTWGWENNPWCHRAPARSRSTSSRPAPAHGCGSSTAG